MNKSAENVPTATRPAKFSHPDLTADGQVRARVALSGLQTLWINTGTLCNLSCPSCYIESTPKNDSLVYFTAGELDTFLDEITALDLPTGEIGFTGGEPFMNPDLMAMLGNVLSRGLRALVLTNAMRPMMKCAPALKKLNDSHGGALTVRVSIDHYTRQGHESLRQRGWDTMLEGLRWLSRNGVSVHVAGRTCWQESEEELRRGFGRLFRDNDVSTDAANPVELVLFPEMDELAVVPEITESCWQTLGVNPNHMMCATSRMVVRRKGAAAAEVLACTLLAHDPQFSLGPTLAAASRPVKLNHPHCAKFCVLGGGACSIAGPA